MILRKRRFKRGALELNMPEVEIDLGEQGEVVGAHLASNDESHQVIEEFMLAANEAVAGSPDREQGRLPPAGPPRPRAPQAQGVRRVRRQPGDRDQDAPEPVRAPARPRRVGREARGLRRPLRPAPEPQAGASTRPSRKGTTPWPARITATSPRRSAATPTSRSTASSTALLAGKKPRVRLRRAGRPGRALHPDRAAGRGRRARADQDQAAHLPGRANRRALPRRDRGGRGLRLLLPTGRVPGRRAGPRHRAGRRLLLPRSGDPHAGRPTVAAADTGWATGSR